MASNRVQTQVEKAGNHKRIQRRKRKAAESAPLKSAAAPELPASFAKTNDAIGRRADRAVKRSTIDKEALIEGLVRSADRQCTKDRNALRVHAAALMDLQESMPSRSTLAKDTRLAKTFLLQIANFCAEAKGLPHFQSHSPGMAQILEHPGTVLALLELFRAPQLFDWDDPAWSGAVRRAPEECREFQLYTRTQECQIDQQWIYSVRKFSAKNLHIKADLDMMLESIGEAGHKSVRVVYHGQTIEKSPLERQADDAKAVAESKFQQWLQAFPSAWAIYEWHALRQPAGSVLAFRDRKDLQNLEILLVLLGGGPFCLNSAVGGFGIPDWEMTPEQIAIAERIQDMSPETGDSAHIRSSCASVLHESSL